MPLFFVHAPQFLRILTSASCSTARLLTICILFMSLAPLGSIYVLLLSLGNFGVVIDEHDPFSHSLHRPSQNLTFEELWSTMFQEYGNQHQGRGLILAFVPLGKQHVSAHLRIFLPWALSFLLGVIIPTSFTLWSLIRNRRILVERRRRRAVRLDQTIFLLSHEYSKHLTHDDIEIEGELSRETDWNANITSSESLIHDEPIEQKWKVPTAGTSANRSNLSTRIVDEGCAVCLHPYHVNDSVSWSSNSTCVHVFHERCIIEWLSRKNNKKFACPCCRQCFVSLPADTGKAGTIAVG
ncbi:hypothetical protein MPSEU_000729800 [Mayamaea pseudoterrestris]|nr:hypothetical protein MPSEU_000729800 [Mayamaea pseudoterrestris]